MKKLLMIAVIATATFVGFVACGGTQTKGDSTPPTASADQTVYMAEVDGLF